MLVRKCRCIWIASLQVSVWNIPSERFPFWGWKKKVLYVSFYLSTVNEDSFQVTTLHKHYFPCLVRREASLSQSILVLAQRCLTAVLLFHLSWRVSWKLCSLPMALSECKHGANRATESMKWLTTPSPSWYEPSSFVFFFRGTVGINKSEVWLSLWSC